MPHVTELKCLPNVCRLRFHVMAYILLCLIFLSFNSGQLCFQVRACNHLFLARPLVLKLLLQHTCAHAPVFKCNCVVCKLRLQFAACSILFGSWARPSPLPLQHLSAQQLTSSTSATSTGKCKAFQRQMMMQGLSGQTGNFLTYLLRICKNLSEGALCFSSRHMLLAIYLQLLVQLASSLLLLLKLTLQFSCCSTSLRSSIACRSLTVQQTGLQNSLGLQLLCAHGSCHSNDRATGECSSGSQGFI